MGVPRAHNQIFEPLKSCFDIKITLLEKWIREGKIAAVDPHHLLYSIWATTQHYADFEAQIKELSPEKTDEIYKEAKAFLLPMYRKHLAPVA